jgi:hypothetical protein
VRENAGSSVDASVSKKKKKKKKKIDRDPFELTFSNPRIWRRARHKPTSIAGG